MKRFLLLTTLLIPISLLGISCYGRTMLVIGDGGPVVAYHYWYYPAWGIYYDYGAHVYFYSDGGTWVRVAHLPPRFHHLGGYVVVESERGRPWARYDDHRAKYPPGQWRNDDGDRGRDHGRRHFDGD